MLLERPGSCGDADDDDHHHEDVAHNHRSFLDHSGAATMAAPHEGYAGFSASFPLRQETKHALDRVCKAGEIQNYSAYICRTSLGCKIGKNSTHARSCGQDR